ncbi:hypothetical protein ACFTSF_04210 [Kribbella sp. NPDC056951]|uniref:hypothetical protein n=1 Tax=Kribbella sp. NPDC056951 TaxID=3345978 RepID=UPI003628554D
MPETLEAETRAMGAAAQLLGQAQSALDQKVAEIANFAVSPAAEMEMQEAKDFMTDERTGRNQLADYLTRTSDGAGGYKGAVDAVTTIYANHSHTSEQRILALLKKEEGPVPIRGGFVDWTPALEYQQDHPGDFQRNPQFAGPPAAAGN